MVLIILILCILVMLFFIYILSNRNKSIFKEKESLKENLEREVKRNEQSEIENRDLQIIIKEKNNKIQNLISKIEEQDFEIERLNSSFLEQKDRIKELSTQIDIEKENGKKLIEELKNRENAIKELEKNKDEVEIKKRLEKLNLKNLEQFFWLSIIYKRNKIINLMKLFIYILTLLTFFACNERIV